MQPTAIRITQTAEMMSGFFTANDQTEAPLTGSGAATL